MTCCCNDTNRIIIVRGNDTNFYGQNFVTLNLRTDIWDLSTMKATITLGGITKTFEDLSNGIDLSYTAAETSKMPFGDINGVLKVYNQEEQIATIESLLPFRVISVVHGNAIAVTPAEFNIEVKQGGETVMNIDIEAGVSVEVGATTTLPAGSKATVTNSGSDGHVILNFGIPQGIQGEQGPVGPDGKDAKINGVNTLTITATNGVQLNQSGDTANIDGKPLQDGISDINSKIPSSASSSNKLADVDFVNSSINNMAAFYVTYDVAGDPFPTRASLVSGPWYFRGQLRQPTQNDYALVSEDETHDDETSRFMFDGNQWVWQYTLNNTKFTQAQIDAINSGMTESLVAQIGLNEQAISDLQDDVQSNTNAISGKQNTITSTNKLSSDLIDDTNHTNKFVTEAEKTTWNNKQDAINDLDDVRAGAMEGSTAIQGVQVNGTDLTIDSNKKVNIPYSSSRDAGVCMSREEFGTWASGGIMRVQKASSADISTKTNNYKPIVPSGLDEAVKIGVTTNTNTLTDAEKESACNWLGAVTLGTAQEITGEKTITKALNIIGTGDAHSLRLSEGTRINVYGTTKTILGFTPISQSSYRFLINHNSYELMLRGLNERPYYNNTNTTLALSSDVPTTPSDIGAEAATLVVALGDSSTITLASNTIYNGGTLTALTIQLPSGVDNAFTSEIDFTSGETATTFTYPNTLKWIEGDDVASQVFTPVANKRYICMVIWDGTQYVGIVRGVE